MASQRKQQQVGWHTDTSEAACIDLHCTSILQCPQRWRCPAQLALL